MLKATELITKPSHDGKSDESLMTGYRSGDEAAATSLYLRYAPRLRKLAQRYCTPEFAGRFDADDVLQSVFRVFFKGIRSESYQVPPCGEMWALLMVLAINKIRNLIDFHQATKRAIDQTSPITHPILDADESTATWLRLVVEEQVRGLPESHRTIINLRLEGYETMEIAHKVERSRRTIERVLRDFRARLVGI